MFKLEGSLNTESWLSSWARLKLELADNLTLGKQGIVGSVFCTSTEPQKTSDAIDD